MSINRFNTIEFSIPRQMLDINKSGKISLNQSLTKTGNISKRSGKKSFRVITSDDNKPHIINDGILTTHQELDHIKKVIKSQPNKHNKLTNKINKMKKIIKEKPKFYDYREEKDVNDLIKYNKSKIAEYNYNRTPTKEEQFEIKWLENGIKELNDFLHKKHNTYKFI